jgi:hypothetical protein
MDEEARFVISAFMTARFDKGYLTYSPKLHCNEFTMKRNVRLCATRADVSSMYSSQQLACQDFCSITGP